MIAACTLFLVAGLASVVIVTVHELFEQNERLPLPQRPGSDAQWTEMADAMRRYRKHRTRVRDRG